MLKKILVKEVIAPVIVIAIALILYNIISKILKRIMYSKTNKMDEKRKKTLLQLMRNILRAIIVVLVGMIILDMFGIDTKGLLASLSVIGVVLGLSFQDLIKDFIAGIAIVAEGLYRVGDIVTINGFKGEVIQLGLKSTRLKSYTGEIKIITNHSINEVINHTLSNSLAILDIDIAKESDMEQAEKILLELCEKLTKNLPYLKGNVELLGINTLTPTSIRFRITVLTEPMKQSEVQRKMLKEIKLELDKQKIGIPNGQMVSNG